MRLALVGIGAAIIVAAFTAGAVFWARVTGSRTCKTVSTPERG